MNVEYTEDEKAFFQQQLKIRNEKLHALSSSSVVYNNKILCPKCGRNGVIYRRSQDRGMDEGDSTLNECNKVDCRHQWYCR